MERQSGNDEGMSLQRNEVQITEEKKNIEALERKQKLKMLQNDTHRSKNRTESRKDSGHTFKKHWLMLINLTPTVLPLLQDVDWSLLPVWQMQSYMADTAWKIVS